MNTIMKKIYLFLALFMVAAISFPTTAATKWTTYKIMIDPGHGGSDPGASGPSAPHEATLVLRAGLALRDRIVNECGGTVKMTRTTDTFISLSSRKSSSVSYDPYIFCSLHLNAFNKSAKGTETYYYWSSGNSSLLANKVQAQLIANFKKVSGFTPTNRGVKTANYTVIMGSSNVPAVLTEGLFIDNSTEWSIINDNSKQGFKMWVQGHLYGFYDRLVLLNGDIIDPAGSTTTTTPDPAWTVNPTSMEFTCVEGGSTQNAVSIKGSNLTAAPTATISGTGFSIASSSLTKTNSTVTVKFAPTSAGSYSGTLTLKSGSLSATVKLTGTATVAPLAFTEKWNASDQNGTITKFGWDAGKVRNMTYKAGKLYLVYNHSDIKVVNAQTGADLGNLNKAGVETGVLTLCDVRNCDGKIVACNIASGATNTALRVYVWDDDQSNPRVLLNTTEMGGAARVGDCLGFYGTWSNGKLLFGNDDGTTTRILSYAITNGVCSTTPTVINATYDKDGTSTRLPTLASTRVYADASGYWIDGKENYTARLNSSGVREYYVDSDETWGNAFEIFTWKGSQYALTTMYNTMDGESWSAQTDAQKATNYTGGRMKLLRNDDGWAKATDCGEYPEAGLSSKVQNTNCTSNAVVAVNGTSGVEAWVLSTGQGIAYYLSGTASSNTVTEIKPAGPQLSADKTSASMEAVVGQSATTTVKITGSSLTGNISLALSGSNANQFALSSSSLGTSGGSVTVTYTPTAEGSHTATLTASSSGADDVKISLKGTAKNPVVFVDEIGAMDEVWNYSETKGNLSSATWFDTANFTRDVAVNGENLYVLNCKQWGTPVINILNAFTGASKGTLSVEGISGGRAALGAIDMLGGKLIGVNAVTGHELVFYKWDSETAAPTKWATTTPGIAMGDHMSVSGDMTNGAIWLVSTPTNVVYKYTVTNGAVNTTPTIITLSKTIGSINGCAAVAVAADGTLWVSGKDIIPMHFKADGTYIETLGADALGAGFANPKNGTAMELIKFGDKTYMTATTYTGTGTGTDAMLKKGAFSLVDLTDGVAAATAPIGTYPSAGLGTTRNTQYLNALTHTLTNNDQQLYVWVAVASQGVACYTYDGRKYTGVDVASIDATNKMEITVKGSTIVVSGVEASTIDVYSIAGTHVAHGIDAQILDINNLSTGIYIVNVVDVDGNAYSAKVSYRK